MKKFAGNKSLDVIRAQCKAQGVDFNDFLLKQESSDYVVLTSIKGDNHSGQVLFNTFNGTFFGTTDKGVSFDSTEAKHENEPWFQALLSFFYVAEEEKPAEAPTC